MTIADFCCSMRRKFVVGIVAEDRSLPTPLDMVDCIVAWEPRVTFRAVFCCFCGKRISKDEPTRTIYDLPPRGIDQ